GKEVVMGGGKEAPQPVLPRITSRESRQTRRFHTVRRAAQDVVAAIGSSDSVPVARLIPQAAPARPTPAPPTPAQACRLFQSNRGPVRTAPVSRVRPGRDTGRARRGLRKHPAAKRADPKPPARP